MVFQTAIMHLKILTERMIDVIPKILTAQPKLIGTVLVTELDLFLERLSVLNELLPLIPEYKNITNEMIWQRGHIRSMGGFSSYTFDPCWQRIWYNGYRPSANNYDSPLLPGLNLMSDRISGYPVSNINPLFVVDRVPFGMTIDRSTDVTDPIYTNVDVQHLGWMMPIVMPIATQSYDQLMRSVMGPTSRSIEPTALGFERTMSNLAGLTLAGKLATKQDQAETLALPMAPYAMAGAPTASDFVFTPTVTEFRETDGSTFKMKGPILLPADKLYHDVPENERLHFSELALKVKEAKDVVDEKVISWLM
jgi:hypothetical protein